MRSIPFFRFVELSAFLPIFAISFACLYKYSFYSSLELQWVTTQLPLSGILLNAVPIFLDIFVGFLMATSFFLILRNIFSEFILYISCLICMVLSSVFPFLVFGEEGLWNLILDQVFFFYSYILALTVLVALDSGNVNRVILLTFALFSMLFIQPMINYKSAKEIAKVFDQDPSFSRVYFTEEGQKIIPISYTSTDENGKEQTFELDWRLLEIIGDKAIIIVSNRVKLDGIRKPQVRIIDYKLIDRMY